MTRVELLRSRPPFVVLAVVWICCLNRNPDSAVRLLPAVLRT